MLPQRRYAHRDRLWRRQAAAARQPQPRLGQLGAWLDEVVSFHAKHILVVDAEAALHAGVLLAVASAAGVEPDVEDSWIAATAELHDMTVLTFNETDFLPMGVVVCNPGVALPPEARPLA